MPPLHVVPSLSQPARHELCPCYVRPIAAAIDESAFKCLTIPAIRAPRGMNFVHTSRDYPLQELSNLLTGLWESRSSPLFSRELQAIEVLFFCILLLIPLIN